MILVSGSSVNYKKIADVTRPTHERYAKAMGYGYDHVLFRDDDSWGKLFAILTVLHAYPNEDAFWVDADAQFVRFDESIEPLIRGDILLTYQRLGKFRWIFPNAGVMVFRNTHGSRAFLTEALDLRPKYEGHPWWDQAAIYELLGLNPDASLRTDPWATDDAREWWDWGFLPQRWNSTPPDEIRDPIIVHATGLGARERIQYLQEHRR